MFFLLVVVSFIYFKKSRRERNTKEAPAVAVAIDVTTNSANPLDDFRLNHRIDHQVLEMVENPSSGGARRKPRNQRATPTLPTATLCLLFICLISVDVINGHNWIANPKSRIGGLGRTAPCPPRVGNDLHIAVRQSETFPIEWSDGHPGSFVYLTMVKREHEAKLKELNVRWFT